ncbi:RNA-binding protein 48-like [Rhodamnia argentea]|uniref:RNA-binding protein 48 n=1 Tax=Rhodamnia argentea TaxID=178133 RepID=A0A8B8QNK2_9MYRT|nr:RNA-binding protein 48-like [Rhodamnia argentea]
MPQYKDEPPAVRVYTVCDESRYLVVRNVPALGCGDELLELFATYGDVEECKPMDEEDCEPYTDVYWIKFCLDCNARFAKKKLDEYVFYGNRLQVSYAPHFESLSDTREKLEARRKEVLARSNPGRFKGTATSSSVGLVRSSANASSSQSSVVGQQIFNPNSASQLTPHADNSSYAMVSSDLDYFQSHSMNQTVQLVRDKLNKIESSGECQQSGPPVKKARIDNRRRI